MATLSKGYTFGATETVTNTKLHNLVDLGSITGIVDADVAAGAAIDSTKLDLSSAGYLTTGGDFAVTGEYSFSDISFLNVTSLASFKQVSIQSGILTSLMSMGQAYVKDGFFDKVNIASLCSVASFRPQTMLLSSLASMAQANIGLANIQSLACIGSPLHYKGIVSSLASGAYAMWGGGENFVGNNITAGWQLVETADWAGAQHTQVFNTNIESGYIYKLKISGKHSSGGTNTWGVNVSGDSSGTNYSYRYWTDTPSETTGTGTQGLFMGVESGTYFYAEMTFTPAVDDDNDIFIQGYTVRVSDFTGLGTPTARLPFSCIYNGGETFDQITIKSNIGQLNNDAKFWLYRKKLS